MMVFKEKLRNHLAVIIIYLVITGIFTYPLIFHVSSYSVEDDADSYLTQWVLARNVHKLSTDPLDFFQANYFYPHENTLAYTEHQLGSSLLAFPIIKISNNPLLAFNLLILLSYVLSGWGTYLLVTRLTKNRLAGFLAGVIFAFAPFRAIHFSQLHVISTQYLPFILLFLEAIFKNPKFKNYAFFTLFLIWQALTSLHLFLFILIVIAIFIAVRYFINRKQFNLRIIAYFLLSFLIVFIVNLPLLIPYFQLKDVAGSDVYMTNYFTPTLADYLKVTPILHNIFGSPETSDRIFYPGVIVLILFILSLFWIFSKRARTDPSAKKRVLIYIVILISVFLLSLGPYIRFTPHNQGIPGPYLFLEQLISSESSMRAVGRFMIIGVLAMAVIIGYGISQFLASATRKKLYVMVISLSILGEFLIIPPFSPLKLAPQVENRSLLSVSQWLSQQPGDFAILELPLGKSNLLEAHYMYYSIFHNKDRINGFSGYYPQDYFDLKRALIGFPNSHSLEMIKKYSPKYVVIHFNEIKSITPDELEKIADFRLVFKVKSSYVYQFSNLD